MMMNECRRAMRTISCAMMVAAFMAAFHTMPVQAAQIGVLDDDAKTYTITVAEGETVTMSAEDAYALTNLVEGYTFIKDGLGTLSVGAQITGFDRPIVITNGIYEATTSDALGKGGAGAETYVRSGASLRIAHSEDMESAIRFKFHEKICLAGVGFGGAGALFNGGTKDQTRILDNSGDFVLDDDATIRGYGIGFNGNSMNLNGHTLTVDMENVSRVFNLTFNKVETAGNIHVARGRFFFDGDTTYAGGSDYTFTVDGGNDLAFRSVTKPIPWSLVLAGGVNLYPSSPKYDGAYSYNVWSGPVTLNGSVTVNYNGKTSVAIAGPVGGTGGFSVNRENKLHLSCPTNTFSGGVRVIGSSAECLLAIDEGGTLPADGGNLYVQTGTVSLGYGVLELPPAEFNTSGSSVFSNTIPSSVAKVPSVLKNGTGSLAIYGGVEITNTFSVTTGKVELAGVAVDPACATGLYRAATNFTDGTDFKNYVKNNVGVTLGSSNKQSELRQVFSHILKTYEQAVVSEISDATESWNDAKFRLVSYTGYFHNNHATNVTYTFAMSIADIAALWIDSGNVLYNVDSKKVVVNGSSKTYFVTLGSVTLAPGPHKFDVLMGHYNSSSSGPRPAEYQTAGLNWGSNNGFKVRYGAIDANAATNSADFNHVRNGTEAFGTILTTTGGPLASQVASRPDAYRPMFANLSGTGDGTLDLGGGETRTIEGLEGTLTLTNGALTVTGDWDLSLSAVTAKPLTVAAGATLTFGEASRFEPDETFCHGGHAAKVIAQTTDGGGTIVGMPRCEVRSWSLRRTESDGVTRIVAEYTPGFRVIIR